MEWDAGGHEKVDAVVIGAGAVGLAVARALALAGREVIVLEAERMIGSGTSSRNSEVIHAGLYYAPNSMKAQLCVKGKAALYAYCRERGIWHSQLGKLIVACSQGDVSKLRHLTENAARNGVVDLVILSRKEALSIEPELDCSAAVLSPSTGIVDVHELMLSYLGDLENSGGMLVLRAAVAAGRVTERGISLLVDQHGGSVLCCRTVVNCAGLSAQRVASAIEGFPAEAIPARYLAKGNYFKLTCRSPFKHLVYPLPSDGGMGIHLTLDHAGRARFGPDVQWVDEIDYRVSEERLPLFDRAIRRYWPALPESALAPDYCGIRPKLHMAGTAPADFMIQDGRDHGAPGLINLYGIESPGITASLAIGDLVCRLACEGDRVAAPAELISLSEAQG
ncbi:NAD(P)/FAD-dependent oxidoreductase [Mesorhizobium sp. BAC0120]|uniref:NAD(P)/FAD-dependent oxidoreductase n=1 Tax=Mesorhizobium sp. BAC0120 TaxID=3090670 RepID=UPI00298BDFA9|nr:NAD(P)/FAD-dependent oxidoreductase [Mesorhizobium sp. BAC0120]MDW6024731.1 NAD(P)/FAD-dependent oxidoreductase [Mesorhizobium sp. BAC0120]